MRFLVTSLLFVAALVSLLLGVAQRTVWAPVTNHTLTLETTQSTPYVVVPSATLNAFAGTPTVSASGTNQVFAAVGRESDITAWIGSCPRVSIDMGEENASLKEKAIAGGGVLSNPAGSDLWRDERQASKALAIPVDTAEQGALLIASNGIEHAPNKITVNWDIPFDPTSSNTALIIGGILLIAAIITNWLTYRHIRITRGPRRRTPKAPRGPQIRRINTERMAPSRGRRAAGRPKLAIGSSLLVLSLLTGCSSAASGPAASPTESAAVNSAPVSLLASQLDRILNDVALSAANGDKGKDAKLLQNRFNGPALEIRAAHYLLQQRSKKIPALTPIAAGPISFNLPAATDVWPRTVMAVTARTGSSDLPQMLVLEQESPRSNYKVWYTITMLPGAKIPSVLPADVGSAPVASDSLFLAINPKTLPKTYGDVIDLGQRSSSISKFDVSNDEFYQQLSASQASQKAALKKASLKFKHVLGHENLISLSTSDAGALVAVYMKDIYTIKPTKIGSAVTVSGNEKTMLGSNGSIRGVQSTYGNMLLFYVPAMTSKDRIRLLGVTPGLVAVRGL